MKGKEAIVEAVLQSPDEIRQSRTDKEVFLYYKQVDRLYCVVKRYFYQCGEFPLAANTYLRTEPSPLPN